MPFSLWTRRRLAFSTSPVMAHRGGQGQQGAIGRAMADALEEAAAAGRRGEVPVGAVLLGPDGVPLLARSNGVERSYDASAHAELLAMRDAAARLGRRRLLDCTLVVTLEPCAMCAAAAIQFRLGRLVFGAYDPKGGAVEHGPRLFDRADCLHRPIVIGGVSEVEAGGLLRDFFRERR